MAIWDGSMLRSLIPSGVALKSASSISDDMAPRRFRKRRASLRVALNMGLGSACFWPVIVVSCMSLAVLPPCGSAVGASKELGAGLVCSPSLDEPVEGFVIVAFGAFLSDLW